MSDITIIKVGQALIASIPEELRDKDALGFEEDLIHRLEVTGLSGVLLDLSALQMVDSFLGRLFVEIAAGARLMGAHTVLVGIQPAVAITLVELGLELKGIHTALNTENGLRLLRSLR